MPDKDKRLDNLKPFPPGVSGNPGGVPKGKRIATWLAEFGEMSESQWPVENSDRYKALPANAQIALARLRDALNHDKLALANSEYVEPHRNDSGMILPVPVTKEHYQELCREFWNNAPKP